MQVSVKILEKSQIELTVVLSVEEFAPYIEKGAAKISAEVKIDGFRPGKAPFEILKKKIGEMGILEEAAHIAIDATVGRVLEENVGGQAVGQPRVDVTKLAPENSMEYKIVVAVLPEIKLGDYKNLEIEKRRDVSASDKDAEKMVADLRGMRVKEKVVDRSIQDGDKVIADIHIYLDKVPVEGGHGHGATVVVGQDYIIPGFDKNLLGMKKGDVREFKLPYPVGHHMKNLAGKIAEFKVEIKEVYERELPLLNDEFAASFGVKTVEELKKNIKESLNQEKKQKESDRQEREILEKLIAASRFGDLPEILIQSESESMMREVENNVVSHGGKFDDYLTSIKKSRNEMILEMVPEAIKKIKGALVIREIALREKIEISDAEAEERVKEMLKQYQGYAKVEERLREPGYKDYLKNIMANKKVMEKLRGWNEKK